MECIEIYKFVGVAYLSKCWVGIRSMRSGGLKNEIPNHKSAGLKNRVQVSDSVTQFGPPVRLIRSVSSQQRQLWFLNECFKISVGLWSNDDAFVRNESTQNIEIYMSVRILCEFEFRVGILDVTFARIAFPPNIEIYTCVGVSCLSECWVGIRSMRWGDIKNEIS